MRGYLEEGTTTTPFDMVVLNKISRLHLCLDVLRYVPGLLGGDGGPDRPLHRDAALTRALHPGAFRRYSGNQGVGLVGLILKSLFWRASLLDKVVPPCRAIL